MKIGKKMEKSINSQIQAEFDSSYLYLSMAAWFEDADLPVSSVDITLYRDDLEEDYDTD